PVDGRADVPAAELHAAIADADLVVAHAGIGSCLTAPDAGRCPAVLPRRREHGEPADHHHEPIPPELDRRGLAGRRLPAELTAQDLRAAMARRVRVAVTPRTFLLDAV